MRFAIVISLLSLVACAGFLPAGYNQGEELGECLKWRTTIVEKKERLPYPMRGIVVREEQVVQCTIREEIDA
jgi:hypothetical protein